ncbi:hypothetical protein [Paucibacter sp. KBW04]|uniref:hypothetical protein n=1 Tax=Paucibacter sp. KBW04 TaxID=2153361 RepID=UPI001E6323CE|nr:hypothetical protein [Paucibacter sp. KBW04]
MNSIATQHKEKSRVKRLGLSLSLVLGMGLLMPVQAAQASEVVKLARLVITGKRLSAPPVAKPVPPSISKGEVLSQRGDDDDGRLGEARRSQFRPI